MLARLSLIAIALVGASACDSRSEVKESLQVSTTPIQASRATYHAEVLFEFQSARLGDAERNLLDELARKLLADELEGVAATAHADRIGDAAYNERLAARRAGAVRDYLVEKGVSQDLVRVESKGAREPVTAGRCDGMGPEVKQNAQLVACLQPDRRAEIAIRPRAAR